MSKTVLYIGGFKLPDKNAAAHRVMANAKILNALGYKVVFLGMYDDEINAEDGIVQLESISDNILMYGMKYPRSTGEWLRYITGTDKIKFFIEKYNVNVLIYYNYPAIPSLLLKKYLKEKNIKTIADCTEWYGSPDEGLLKKTVKNLDTFLRMRVVNFQVDGVISISKYLQEFYRNTNSIMVPPLVDLQDEKWREAEYSQSNSLNFVYAGQMGNKDRVTNVLRVLKDIKHINFTFHIIGITENEFLSHNDVEFNTEGFVEFHGRLNHKDVLTQVKAADFVVFFREYNRTNNAGFPTKLVEAISCGTPVITNTTSNINDFIINGKNGFMVEQDLESIKKGFLHIFQMEKVQINDMKEYCRNTKTFDYRKYIDEFREFFRFSNI